MIGFSRSKFDQNLTFDMSGAFWSLGLLGVQGTWEYQQKRKNPIARDHCVFGVG